MKTSRWLLVAGGVCLVMVPVSAVLGWYLALIVAAVAANGCAVLAFVFTRREEMDEVVRRASDEEEDRLT